MAALPATGYAIIDLNTYNIGLNDLVSNTQNYINYYRAEAAKEGAPFVFGLQLEVIAKGDAARQVRGTMHATDTDTWVTVDDVVVAEGAEASYAYLRADLQDLFAAAGLP